MMLGMRLRWACGVALVVWATTAIRGTEHVSFTTTGSPAGPRRGSSPTSAAQHVYFAATPQPVVRAMLELAEVTSADVVYDLGSGDGRIPIIAAQRFGARGVGIERDAALVAASRASAVEAGLDNTVRFIEGDFFATDLSAATVVTLWLSPMTNAELEPKLRRELRRGARVVSHQFPIGTWVPTKQIRAGGQDVFLWMIP